MSETTNSEWAEMDVEAYRKKSNVEKKEEPQQDFEVEEPDEVPLTHETVEAEVEEEVIEEPQQEDTIEELDGIQTKGAEKRIRQLVTQRKEREEVIAQQNAELSKLRAELLNSQSSKQTMEVDSLGSKEAALQERIKLAESAYLSAYDDGDKEKLLESQNILQDAKTDLKFVSARKKQLENIQTQVDTNKTRDHQEAQGYTPEPQQQQYDPRAVEWANNNDWFGKDEVTTAVALAIDQQLKTEGYDPSSSDFYEEVDNRLRKELPNKFRVADNTQKPPQQVAGSSRKSSPSNKRKVKLSSKDVSLAKKWGIPLDTYAAEKAKVDKVGDGYSVIGNK